ncbi:MAG TPA: hypothetical protein VMU08_13985 [Rhizomicrobium sp.]|nr:hypothetical protein [Rhizomicrobium sp.]
MPEGTSAPSEEGLKLSTLLAYGLFLLAPVNGITAIAGAIVAYIRRDEARGTIWEGHLRNLIRVFWVGAVVLAIFLLVALQGIGGLFYALFTNNGEPPPAYVGGLLALMPVLLFAGLIFAVWYFYRVVRGLLHALDSKPY